MKKSSRISDVDVTTKRVTLRVDGQALAIVRVPDGTNFGWRVEFSDNTLGSGVFANPERAIRWIASGQPVLRSADVQETKIVAVPYKSKRLDNKAPEPEPEWQAIKREPRRGPIWNGSLSSIPGGPTLFDPSRLLRRNLTNLTAREREDKAATRPPGADNPKAGNNIDK